MNDQEQFERELFSRSRQINRLSIELEDLILAFREVADNYSIWSSANTINVDLDDVYVPCIRGTRNGRNFNIALTSRQLGEGIAFYEMDGTTHSLAPKLVNPGSPLEEKPIGPAPVHKNRTSYTFY